MTIRDLYQLADSTLATKLTYMAGVVTATPSAFGLTAPQATAMSDAAETFTGLITDNEAARAAAEVAMAAKTDGREEALSTFATYLNLMYATPSVTDASIISLSLAPRSTNRTPAALATPADFVVTPFADGTVKFKWGKNGNAYGVTYVIEHADADAGNWTPVVSTTKTRITLSGYTPGTAAWFRVSATRNGDSSLPTAMEGIYLPAPGSSLQIAA